MKDYEFLPNLSSEASKRGGNSPHDALRKVSFNIPMRSEILEFVANRMISTYPLQIKKSFREDDGMTIIA